MTIPIVWYGIHAKGAMIDDNKSYCGLLTNVINLFAIIKSQKTMAKNE